MPLSALLAPVIVEGLKWAPYLIALGLGKNVVLGGLDFWTKQRLGGKQINLQTMLAQSEMEAAKLTNEENRRQAGEYTTMLREEKQSQREESRQSRQTQLLATLMQAAMQQQESAAQMTAQTTRPVPPTSMVGLLRGW